MRIALLTYRGNMYCGGQGIYAAYLAREWKRAGHDVHVIAGPPLPELAWPADWELARRPAAGDDHVSVTGAFAAIAETGSLVMLSGPGHPTSLNFLPDDHIVVLRASQVVAHMEDVWALLRARDGGMPRTVNIITGPSRTADVEQTIQLGAHGPRRLHVVLVAG